MTTPLGINADGRRLVIFLPRQSGKSQRNRLYNERMQTKLAQENAALHKTSAFLADEARRTEKAMERGRYRR